MSLRVPEARKLAQLPTSAIRKLPAAVNLVNELRFLDARSVVLDKLQCFLETGPLLEVTGAGLHLLRNLTSFPTKEPR
jgi:hypothetical protein